ncbi:CBS domain-containing protein [Bosea sp. (in: a-proteobacteria)]|jgi:CBS domain-containing protein
MRVADIMTSPVVAIGPSAAVSEAAQLMLGSHFSGLPVVTGGKQLVGIVTEGDFLRRSELGTVRKRPRWLEFIVSAGKQADEYVQTHGRRVEEVMTRDPVTIEPGATLDELVELMSTRRIKRVPVVAAGRLVGIVARSDLMRAMLRILPASAPQAGDDEHIRQMVVGELAKQPWGNAIRVKVDRGVVELSGAIFDERARDAARVAAENTAGVTEVVDQLAWIEPVSGLYILPYPA